MATLTALQRLEKRQLELGLSAKRSLGQNFLVSDGVIGRILDAVAEEKPRQVVEIGPGCGALTDLLIPLYPDLMLIELDRDLAEFWRGQGQKVIEADALRLDWSFAAGRFLVSNLPYQISSSLVIERSLDSEPLQGMVLMFQKEVAQRIRALPRSEHYGMLSVVAQEFWTIETVCDAGSREFKPAPKVSSRVLKFRPRASTVADRAAYLAFVKAGFQQRRRVLSTNLASLDARYDRARLPEWLAANGKGDKARAEELSPPEIRALYEFLKAGEPPVVR